MPPAPPPLAVWFIDWRALDQKQIDQLHAPLNAEERARAARFIRPDDQHRSALGRGVLRCLAGHALGADPASLVLDIGPRGKPAVSGHKLEVNLSHSGDWIAICLGTGAPLGVDVQAMRDGVDMTGVARLSLHPDEQLRLSQTKDPAERLDIFYRLWALREAALKATGDGFFAERSDLNTLPLAQGWTRRAYGPNIALDLIPLPAADGYRAALARVAGPAQPPDPVVYYRSDLPLR